MISAHIVGMYGLVLFVGDLIDRIGRREALVGGLAIMAASTLGLVWAESVFATGVALFGLGLGWSLSYVSATSTLVDLAPPDERGQLVGFSDLLSGLTGAALALLGGLAYSAQGVQSLPSARAAVPRAGALARRSCAGTRGRGRSGAWRLLLPFRRRRTACAPLSRMQKTWNAKPGEVTRRWYVVDAEGQTLGRLATRIADTLRGKGKPIYTPARRHRRLRRRRQRREDPRHRQQARPEDVLPPFGLSRAGCTAGTLREQLERRPTEVLRKAVKGMLPRNRLASAQIGKLKIYAGPEHPHEAQAPEPMKLETR